MPRGHPGCPKEEESYDPSVAKKTVSKNTAENPKRKGSIGKRYRSVLSPQVKVKTAAKLAKNNSQMRVIERFCRKEIAMPGIKVRRIKTASNTFNRSIFSP